MSYKIKDTVWIHIGERKLTSGKVVHVFNLEEGGRDFYVIEIETGIDNIYEVRDYEQISPDAKGPINLFRNQETRRANRYFRKVGIKVPDNVTAESVIDLLPAEKPKRKYYRPSKK